MYRRLATSLLMMITVIFFVFHSQQKDEYLVVDSQPFDQYSENFVIDDEFLLLMDEGDEKYLQQVLSEFGLKIVLPLAQWVQVARIDAPKHRRVIALSDHKAQNDLRFAAQIAEHHAVHSVYLNYVQNENFWSSPVDLLAKSSADLDEELVAPSDPYLKYQWHLAKESGINIFDAWRMTTGSEKTVLAIVDRNFLPGGIDLYPEHCQSRRYYYENISDYFLDRSLDASSSRTGHGAEVLSTVAPCTDNSLGLSGIDWHAQVFLVDSLADSSLSARLLGLLWAAAVDVCAPNPEQCLGPMQKNAHPAQVINASFGLVGSFSSNPPIGPVLDAIGRINQKGAIVVASAGNENQLADNRLPGSSFGVISVGSSDRRRKSSGFSNFGQTVDVVAPGEDILGLRDGRAISLNGTSFSAPIVSGVVALMLAIRPGLQFKQVQYILKASARPMSCSDYCPTTMKKYSQKKCRALCCQGERAVCAGGIIDAYQALRLTALGIPERALVDVSDYYHPLSDDNDLQATIIVQNWGGKSAVVRLRSSDKNLKIAPSALSVPAFAGNKPGERAVKISYSAMPPKRVQSSIVIEAADADEPKKFHDRTKVIIDIAPDH